MTPEQLKASILQYAIQGKLVEQRPEEGSAEDLYQAIQKEKQKFIKEGKIKKGKILPEIEENEIYFDIPETWKWLRLNDIVYNHGQKTPDSIFSYIDIGSIDNIHQKLNIEENLIDADKAPSRARKTVKFGDIIYSTVRPYLHNTCIIDKEFKAEPIASTGFAVLSCYEGIYNKYLFYYLLSPAFDSYANATDNAKGVAYPAINDDKLYRAIIPIPPLKEQHRIVAKIEELLPFVDRYAASYEKLEQFNAKFPEDMKKSILQYAIQGKLVEQRPEEGSAEDLYKQIQEEKQKLIKEGKIKKERPLAKITEDEIPFDIPDNWKWCRLIDCVSILGDGIHGTPIYSADGEYCFINGNNLSDGIIEIKPDTKRVSFNKYEKYKRELNVHTVLVSINGTIGNVAFYSDEKVVLGKSACYFNLVDLSLKKYIYWILKTNYFLKYATTNATGSTIKNVSLTTMKSFLIPLPPLEEQRRIVAKIEKLLPYCDKKKKKKYEK